MLRLPILLLRAHGTLTPPDDWPEGATLGSAWRLEAVCAGISSLTTDPPPPVDTTGAGVLLPIVGTSAPSRVWTISCPLPAWATFVPPPAWATFALSSRGADPPTTLM